MTRPCPAHVRVVPVAQGAVHVCKDGGVLVAILMRPDAALPRGFTPPAWLVAVSRAFDLYLFQRFAR